MSRAATYLRTFNFQNQQAATPSAPVPAQHLDNEFNAVKTTFDGIVAAMAEIQRDDGALANLSVGFDQLKPELAAGLAPPTLWVSGTFYVTASTVFRGSSFYRAAVKHTASADFTADLAAGKWFFVFDFADIINELVQPAEDGSQWFRGDADPDNETGKNGDFYLQTGIGDTGTIGDVWVKAAGVWSIDSNIRGPAGEGDDSTSGSVTPGHMAVFVNDGVIEDGGPPFSGDYDDLSNKPELFSGDYDDLSNKPTLGTMAAAAAENYGALADQNAWTAKQIFEGGQTPAAVKFADNDDGVGPILDIERVSDSPAASDSLGRLNFSGRNDAAEKTDYANVTAQIISAADGNESGQFYFQAMIDGVLTTLLTWGKNAITGAASIANMRAALTGKLLTTDAVYGAVAEVTLTDAAPIALDFAAFTRAGVTITANRTFGDPSNEASVAGKTGRIRVTASGDDWTITKHADMKCADGVWDDPIEIPDGQSIYIYFEVEGANHIQVLGIVENPS